jgi:6-phosphogluconolactonase
MRFCLFLLLFWHLPFITLLSQSSDAQKQLLIGTFSQRGSEGIYAYKFDPSTLQIDLQSTNADGESPSFLVFHPNNTWVFAAYRAGQPAIPKQGSIVAYTLDKAEGRLHKISTQASGGEGPCHISVDPLGHYLYVSHYQSGNLVIFRIGTDGSISPPIRKIQHLGSGPNKTRQEAAHLHAAIPSADGRFLYVSDLGMDLVEVYRVQDLASTNPDVTPIQTYQHRPGAGPRHLKLSSNGKFAYVIEELSSSIVQFSVDQKTGKLHFIDHQLLFPKAPQANWASELALSSDGRFLYAANRSNNRICMYKVNPKSGKLKRLGDVDSGGRTPRHFFIDPAGHFVFVANQDADLLTVFQRNPKTGRLAPSGKEIKVQGVCWVGFWP